MSAEVVRFWFVRPDVLSFFLSLINQDEQSKDVQLQHSRIQTIQRS